VAVVGEYGEYGEYGDTVTEVEEGGGGGDDDWLCSQVRVPERR